MDCLAILLFMISGKTVRKLLEENQQANNEFLMASRETVNCVI